MGCSECCYFPFHHHSTNPDRPVGKRFAHIAKKPVEYYSKPTAAKAKPVLTIAPLRASQASHYFTKDNYSLTTQASQDSRWFGKGAAALGLTGEVDAVVFKALLEGKMPNGKPLTGKTVTNLERHRAGFDQCFEAPKSVSIVALWKGDDRVIEAHQQAVKEAIALTEEWCAQARVWDGKEQDFPNHR
jgi:hypothetical protein